MYAKWCICFLWICSSPCINFWFDGTHYFLFYVHNVFFNVWLYDCHYTFSFIYYWYAYASPILQLKGDIYPSHTIRMSSSISWLVILFLVGCLHDLYLHLNIIDFDWLFSVIYFVGLTLVWHHFSLMISTSWQAQWMDRW